MQANMQCASFIHFSGQTGRRRQYVRCGYVAVANVVAILSALEALFAMMRYIN